MTTTNKRTPVVDEPNRSALLHIMETEKLSIPEVAKLTDCAVETVRGYTMPNRSSSRASKVPTRFISLLKLQVQEMRRKRVEELLDPEAKS